VIPSDGPTGRNNNHGFEGLTVSGDGKDLYLLLQAATNQEGGLKSQTERYTRLLEYDISNPSQPRYTREFVVPLPLYVDPSATPAKKPKVAAQSEILHLQAGQFLILARDSNAGHGQAEPRSTYRHIDLFDVSAATDVPGALYDAANSSVASARAIGVLRVWLGRGVSSGRGAAVGAGVAVLEAPGREAPGTGAPAEAAGEGGVSRSAELSPAEAHDAVVSAASVRAAPRDSRGRGTRKWYTISRTSRGARGWRS
jgi:hypothetical protein